MPVVWCIVVTLSVFGGITTRGVTGVRPTLARAVAEMLARDRERISRSTCFINAVNRPGAVQHDVQLDTKVRFP